MPEWMNVASSPDGELDFRSMVMRLTAAMMFGCASAGIYRLTQRRGLATHTSLTPTLVLLSIIIAMVTMAIGNSVARAFSLVGALAIVRFRTVVEDTRDTAFVIFSVAVGLAVGAGLIEVPLVGMPFVFLASYLFRRRDASTGRNNATLVVRVAAGPHPDALLQDVLTKYLDFTELRSAETARQGSAIDLTYDVCTKPKSDRVALVTELNTLVGVQDVKLSR